MGISETYFHEDIEAVEEQYRRRVPAKPRSVKIEEAMRRLKLVDGQRDRMLAELSECRELLMRVVPDEFLPHLTESNSQWIRTTGDQWRIPSARRHQVDTVLQRGAETVERDIDAWWREKRREAQAEIAAAESLPVLASEEDEWSKWSREMSEKVDEMHNKYDQQGYWR